MPPPPPRPPPGPPPPPAPTLSSQPSPAKPTPPISTDRSAVLLDIQKGARLKKVDRSQIKDRSSPLVSGGGGGASAVSSDSPIGSSSTNNNRNVGSRPENGTNAAASGGMLSAPPAGLGGLFANGMPTLKRTGFRKDSPPDENTSPPSQPMTNNNKLKTSPPAAPPLVTANGPPSRNLPTSPPGGVRPAPKPINVPPSQRRLSGSEFEKPVPSPKPSVLSGSNPSGPPNFNHVTNGSATTHIQRTTERPSIHSMTLQKPKHPPPPLPPGPPPTRNISQTMPRPVKHQRPALPTDMAASPPTPPPVPGRPPSFRKSGEQRVRTGPPPSAPPSGQPSNGASQMVPPNSNGGYPRPPFSMNGTDVADNGRGLMNNMAQQRPTPPSRPPVPPPINGSLGIPQSASVHSLPGSPSTAVRPPKRHDSLTTVAQDQISHMAALNQMIARNGQSQSSPQPPKAAPGRPGSSPRMSTVSSAQNFEAKFNFHRINELPQPMGFSGMTKTYPSAKTRSNSRSIAPPPPV